MSLYQSIHRTDIKATIFSIIWAAGPVIVIAITLGYYLSHGTVVPTVTVIYFSLYVLFVGLVGFVNKIILTELSIVSKKKCRNDFCQQLRNLIRIYTCQKGSMS